MFGLGVAGGKSCSRLGLLTFALFPFEVVLFLLLRIYFGFLGTGYCFRIRFLVASSLCDISWLVIFYFLVAGQVFGVWHP